MTYTLPPLPYDYDALSKSISADIMELHHRKHHQAYVDKLNAALVSVAPTQDVSDITQLLMQIETVPVDTRAAVRNHGGGHYNHQLFWETMSPSGGGQPKGALADDIISKYGTFQNFVDAFTTSAIGLFGSGWVWLTADLEIIPMPNQDNPLMQGGVAPLMGLDVWEHAYYLDYRNRRDEYIRKWWDVVDWDRVSSRR